MENFKIIFWFAGFGVIKNLDNISLQTIQSSGYHGFYGYPDMISMLDIHNRHGYPTWISILDIHNGYPPYPYPYISKSGDEYQ